MVLAALLRDTESFSEVIIGYSDPVDQCYNDTTRHLYASLGLAGKTIKFTSGVGLVDTKLAMGSIASNEIVLVLDDDCIPGVGYFEMLKHFVDPKIGMVSGSIQSPYNPGYMDWSAESIPFKEQEWCNDYGFRHGKMYWIDKYQVYRRRSGPWLFKAKYLVGAGLFIRRHLMQLWDPQTDRVTPDGQRVIEGEEVDLSWSVRKAGYYLLYDARHVVWHLYDQGGRVRSDHLETHLENWNYILLKHGHVKINSVPAAMEHEVMP